MEKREVIAGTMFFTRQKGMGVSVQLEVLTLGGRMFNPIKMGIKKQEYI